MNQSANKHTTSAGTFAIVSLAVGILGMFCFFYPPIQLFCGSAAIMLAYLSKTGGKLKGTAVIGIVLGVCSILLSIFFFHFFLTALHIMDDPVNVALYREAMDQFMAQYDALINGFTAK